MKGVWSIRLGCTAGLLLAAMVQAAGVIFCYNGDSDPSAAAAVDEIHFVVADDEHNILRVYETGKSSPVFNLDMSTFLKADAQHPEADIEGAARVGDRVYWITSHGRNKEGQIRRSRYRFFATDIIIDRHGGDPNAILSIIPTGQPCEHLVQDMLAAPQLKSLNLGAVTRLDEKLSKKERAMLAPKENGLNIEGLAVGPDGKSLWIGLRNPQFKTTDGKAMATVIPLLNPEDVIDGKTALFGEVILLDLGGRGIRSMDYVQNQRKYWVVAGSAGSDPNFAIFRYDFSIKKLSPVNVIFPDDFTPEGLFVLPGRDKIGFMSDDGMLEKEVSSPTECISGEFLTNGRCPNKYLSNFNKRTFRVMEAALSD